MRPLVFDPTVERFAEQWQRYDWRLLQNGHVFRYADADGLGAAGDRLASLDYLVHRTDAAEWRTQRDVHAGLAGALSFPEHYGHNLDALRDVLRDLAQYDFGSDPAATGTVLLIEAYQQVVDVGPEFANAVLDCFAETARFGLLVGHPMLCLVECTCDLGWVGALSVLYEPAP